MMNFVLLNRSLHHYPESSFWVLLCEKKANWIGRILLGNCLLKHFIGEKIGGK